MSGSVIIAPKVVWPCGRHFFDPIIEPIREAYLADGVAEEEVDAIFATLDQGFAYITVDELSPAVFRRFIEYCRRQWRQLDEAKSIHGVTGGPDPSVLAAAAADLVSMLERDPRGLQQG